MPTVPTNEKEVRGGTNGATTYMKERDRPLITFFLSEKCGRSEQNSSDPNPTPRRCRRVAVSTRLQSPRKSQKLHLLSSPIRVHPVSWFEYLFF
ncbi:hypothetical protein L6452_12007 [Arctium lappa]|uniref:Uncharacterized protein n=1 Tax=Arctium lappa TaxID=4217 RepID=A0ACB9DQ98_ARCLA|nr:hypothetical protein L6452_12007 [Arctium lappa]